MGLGIQIRGYEEAAGVFIYAELCKLDLVVVDVLVETHNNGSHLQVDGFEEVEFQDMSITCLL